MSQDFSHGLQGPNLSKWIEEIVGDELAAFLTETTRVQERARSFALEISKDRTLREVEKINLAQNLLRSYIRPVSELAKALSIPRERMKELIMLTGRSDLSTFASWIYYHQKDIGTLSAARNRVIEDWFSEEPTRRMPHIVALAADSIALAKIADEVSSYNKVRDTILLRVKDVLTQIEASATTDWDGIGSSRYKNGYLPLNTVEKVVETVLESELTQIPRTTWLKDFRELSSSASADMKIDVMTIIQWLTSYLSKLKGTPMLSTAQKFRAISEEAAESKNQIVLLLKDLTGDYYAIGESSKKAFDEGVQSVVRPHDLNKNLGIQLESAQFQIAEARVPNWLWLNYCSTPDQVVQESSIFLASNREPQYKNIRMLHTWIHKALIGTVGRDYLKKQSESIGITLTEIIRDCLIQEDKKSVEALENLASEEETRSGPFKPLFLLNLTIERRPAGSKYVEIEGWGELRREFVAAAGFPWIIESAAHMTNLMSRLYRVRLQDVLFPCKMISRFKEKMIVVLTGFPDGPESGQMKAIGFVESEQGEFTPAEISRKYEMLIRRQNAQRLGLPPQPSLHRMSAEDSQMVFDHLPY